MKQSGSVFFSFDLFCLKAASISLLLSLEIIPYGWRPCSRLLAWNWTVGTAWEVYYTPSAFICRTCEARCRCFNCAGGRSRCSMGSVLIDSHLHLAPAYTTPAAPTPAGADISRLPAAPAQTPAAPLRSVTQPTSSGP